MRIFQVMKQWNARAALLCVLFIFCFPAKGKFIFAANGKALALDETEGFVKVVADPEGHLVGIHIMGPHASDLIHEGVLAIRTRMKTKDFHSLIHAHPTLSEALHEAILGLDGEAIHLSPAKPTNR